MNEKKSSEEGIFEEKEEVNEKKEAVVKIKNK